MARSIEQDMEYIREVAKLLDETGMAEIAVRRQFAEGDKLSVRLAKFASRGAVVASVEPPVPAARETAAVPSPADGGDTTPATVNSNAVTAPMVGTVYLAPEPGAGHFVTPGDTVAKGQTLLIIEAMKTMNQIPAPRAGTVQEVLVEDGEPVEFGTPLVTIS